VARPDVSVVVPFLGSADDAAAMVAALTRLRLEATDELIVADGTENGVLVGLGREAVRVVPATERRSPYYARNAGAAVASTGWLLFTDADCVPPADLLDRLLDPEPGSRVALVAGEARGSEAQTALLARWARSRRGAIVSHHVQPGFGPRPAGSSVNLLVRADAFAAVGGFCAVRSDADLELCWRLQERGWALEYRPAAVVEHLDPERLGAVLRQAEAYGAGRRWLRASYGPSVPAPALLSPLLRALAGALAWVLTARLERAAFKLVDGLVAAASWCGYRFGDNRA
jgi:GT2 family glycosyltransferase